MTSEVDPDPLVGYFGLHTEAENWMLLSGPVILPPGHTALAFDKPFVPTDGIIPLMIQ